MAKVESLLDIKRVSLGEFTLLKDLKAEDEADSQRAGRALVKAAKNYGLSVRDYLTLAIKPEGDYSGYELALAELNLPTRNDIKHGVVLQAASETFQTYSGTRALFPEVIDDIVRWASRQDDFERVDPFLANSRPISGNELLSTVVNDDSDDRAATFSVSELGRIPVRTIRTSEQTVKIYKHGSALRTSYEFDRRASLELIVPFMRRIARELELSKVTAATNVLINGDGVNGAATEVDQSSYNGASYSGETATNGTISWAHFVYWLVQRAKAGVPVDTVLMNWDAWFQWNKLWGKPIAGETNAAAIMERMGVNADQMPTAMNLNVRPVLSSAVPAGKLIGITRGETLEEIIESGSNIEESERNILNQSITMTKTENTGYRLLFADTRSVFDFGN